MHNTATKTIKELLTIDQVFLVMLTTVAVVTKLGKLPTLKLQKILR